MPPALPAEALGTQILAEARALGFHRVGLVPVEPAARHGLYRDWLAAGHHGEMAYLATPEHMAGRADPRTLLASARTVVVVALSYASPGGGGTVPLRTGPTGQIARYARGTDYHTVLRERLNALARRVAAAAGQSVAVRACADTAPVLERDLAERAGVGFIAKNTMLIAPGLGSYVVLGELLLDVEARMPAPTAAPSVKSRCGECRACLDACPTGAFVDAHVLDARRCIAYLTIELTGPIPRDLRVAVGTRIFGCDVCQEVCPFNAAPDPAPPDPALAPAPARTAPELIPLLALGAAQFRKLVRRTSMRRVHRQQLLRNVCVALGNAGDPAAIPALRGALEDRHPLVRAHAAWALGRLGDRAGLLARADLEADPIAREEITAALAALAP